VIWLSYDLHFCQTVGSCARGARAAMTERDRKKVVDELCRACRSPTHTPFMAHHLPSFPSARQAQISAFIRHFAFYWLTGIQSEQTRETCSMSCRSRSKPTPCSAPGWVGCLLHTCTALTSHSPARNEMASEVGQRGRSYSKVALLWLDDRSRFGTQTFIPFRWLRLLRSRTDSRRRIYRHLATLCL